MNSKKANQQTPDDAVKNQAQNEGVQDLDLDDLDEVIGGANVFANLPRTNTNPIDENVRTNG